MKYVGSYSYRTPRRDCVRITLVVQMLFVWRHCYGSFVRVTHAKKSSSSQLTLITHGDTPPSGRTSARKEATPLRLPGQSLFSCCTPLTDLPHTVSDWCRRNDASLKCPRVDSDKEVEEVIKALPGTGVRSIKSAVATAGPKDTSIMRHRTH